MIEVLNTSFSKTRIEAVEDRVADAADSGETAQISALIAPLRKRLRHQRDCAVSLLWMIECGRIPLGQAVELVAEIFGAYRHDVDVVARIGRSLEGARDIDQLNLAAPQEPVFGQIVSALEALSQTALGHGDKVAVLDGLSTAARMTARQHDELAGVAYRQLLQLEPDNDARHYGYGLFLKTRGRFAEGMAANARARSLCEATVESYEWNYGICATGAGEGEAALDVWTRMGQKIAMGRFGLPEGRYPQCKVRLAQRPLAERDRYADDPGLEETIWIERLSPCHGIVRSVLFQDLGVDYGDVVLFDGAPVTYHRYGDTEVPVFPHLATLRYCGYRFFDFAATQQRAGQISDASAGLPADAVVYSHTERVAILCQSCWRDADIDHEHD
ncbi:MAG: prenyltransferase, partial [Pseudomonadota bacterium]